MFGKFTATDGDFEEENPDALDDGALNRADAPDGAEGNQAEGPLLDAASFGLGDALVDDDDFEPDGEDDLVPDDASGGRSGALELSEDAEVAAIRSAAVQEGAELRNALSETETRLEAEFALLGRRAYDIAEVDEEFACRLGAALDAVANQAARKEELEMQLETLEAKVEGRIADLKRIRAAKAQALQFESELAEKEEAAREAMERAQALAAEVQRIREAHEESIRQIEAASRSACETGMIEPVSSAAPDEGAADGADEAADGADVSAQGQDAARDGDSLGDALSSGFPDSTSSEGESADDGKAQDGPEPDDERQDSDVTMFVSDVDVDADADADAEDLEEPRFSTLVMPAVVVCPECGHALQPDERVCPECGAYVPDPQLEARQEQKRFEARICPNCGAGYGPNDRFCMMCGHAL